MSLQILTQDGNRSTNQPQSAQLFYFYYHDDHHQQLQQPPFCPSCPVKTGPPCTPPARFWHKYCLKFAKSPNPQRLKWLNLCKVSPSGDIFNYKTPHFLFRWKEEDKSDWQRVEPCLEWGNPHSWTDACSNMQISLGLLKGFVLMTSIPSDICCSLFSQVLEFDLKGTPLDSASCIDVVVKDYETIGKDK